MKLRWKFAGGIVLMTIIALGAQETMIQSKAAAQNSEDTTLLQIAFRKGVDFYPYAGQVVKPGDGPRYPYAVYKAGTPMFQVDPAWPKFPERNWDLGDVPGVAVDSQGNVWMIHRPKTLNGQGEGNGKGILANLKPPQADAVFLRHPLWNSTRRGTSSRAGADRDKGLSGLSRSIQFLSTIRVTCGLAETARKTIKFWSSRKTENF